MILAKIRVSGIDANLVEWKEVPAGIRGAQVAFEYADPTWDGLEKTVVFRGCVTRDVLRAGTLVEIPPECVETPGAPLKVGVYGTDPDNAVAIPTLWADLGRVKSAADPSGDESAGDGLPVWAQILALIGDLDDLGTAAKDTLVAAINEAATKGGGSVSEEEVWAIVDRYLQEHPVTVTETDPTVPSWAKQPQKPTYTAAEVGARPASWMPSASDVGADPAGTAAAAVSGHNTATDAHNDIRLDLKKINDKLTAFFDSDDQTLDELSEIVAYITSNKSLIDAITTSKVSVSDIVDNLTTNAANRPLSAAQGVVLNGLISTVSSNLSKYQLKGDYALKSEIPAKLPNPAHLTINGYRYDGSKTLFMDVQERSFYEKPGATLADNASVTSGQYTWINYNAVDGYEKAQVIFDGVTYACPITFKKSITEYGDESFFYIGNYNNNAPEYPFTFFGYVGSDSANLSVSGGTHTISVTLDAFVKKIDPKFYDTGTTTKTLFYERDSDADGGIDDYGYIPELVAGVTYEVEWGGEVYTDTAKKVIDVLGVSQDDTVVLPDGTEYQPGNDVAWGDLSFYIGGEPTMPIRMEYMEGGSTMLFNMTGVAGVRHVKIYVVEKTPSGGGGAPYVAQDTAPDDISVLWVDTSDNSGNGGGVSSWNDLKDRPFGTIPAQYELEWDGVIGDRLAIDLSILGEEGFLVKVSDKAYTKKELIGKYCIDTSDNELAIRSDDFTVLLPGSFSLFDGIVSVVYDASVTNAAFGAPDGYITNGTYFMCYPGNNYYVRGIATAPERIEKLDVKYIPNLRSLAPFYTQNLLEWSETGKWHKIYKSVDDRDYMEMWESIKTQCFAAVNLYENGTVLIPLCCDIALEEYWGRALLPPSLSGATNLYEIVVHFRLSEFNYLLLDSGIPAH